MPPQLPLIKRGTRTIVSGRTGSGKTTLAKYLMEKRSPQHWVILNPKHTQGYRTLPNVVVLDGWDPRKFEKAIMEHRFVLLNFKRNELNHDFMDGVILHIHENYDDIGICCDELYYLHKGMEAGDGLIGLLTRGRERNQSFLGLVQRPKRISLFAFSESDHIVSMALNLEGDRARMVEATGNEDFIISLPKHVWRWYNVDADTAQLWGPVPIS